MPRIFDHCEDGKLYSIFLPASEVFPRGFLTGKYWNTKTTAFPKKHGKRIEKPVINHEMPETTEKYLCEKYGESMEININPDT